MKRQHEAEKERLYSLVKKQEEGADEFRKKLGMEANTEREKWQNLALESQQIRLQKDKTAELERIRLKELAIEEADTIKR